MNENDTDGKQPRDGEDASRVREVVDAFLGAQTGRGEVRAMLRAWIEEVRRNDMPPEQALKQFKELLPTDISLATRHELMLGGHTAAELISLFIQEYYRVDGSDSSAVED